jgi:hypothetical protein
MFWLISACAIFKCKIRLVCTAPCIYALDAILLLVLFGYRISNQRGRDGLNMDNIT